MKAATWRIGVAALMTAIVSSASAKDNWAQVSKDDFSTIYMDAASRRTPSNGIVTIDALTDYDATSPKAAAFGLAEKGLSEIEKASFDCVNRQYRSEGGAWYAGQMGEGKITKTYPPRDQWSPAPDYYDGLFAKVCAARTPE